MNNIERTLNTRAIISILNAVDNIKFEYKSANNIWHLLEVDYECTNVFVDVELHTTTISDEESIEDAKKFEDLTLIALRGES